MELRERMQVCNFHFQLIVKALLLQIVTSMTRRSWSSLMKRKLIQVTLFRCKKKFNLQKEWNCSRLRKKAHRQIYSQVKGFSTNKRFVFLVGGKSKQICNICEKIRRFTIQNSWFDLMRQPVNNIVRLEATSKILATQKFKCTTSERLKPHCYPRSVSFRTI